MKEDFITITFFPMGKTTGVDLGDMKNFFSMIFLFSKDYVSDIQSLGRDRNLFI